MDERPGRWPAAVGPGEAGHRRVPHTADLRIEAWAPSRERCVAEAVAALVDSFADVSAAASTAAASTAAASTATVEFRVNPATDPDLLVAVLDEVIYRMDTEAQLPVAADVTPADGGLDVRFSMTGTAGVELVGAVPKAVSLHELRFGPDTGGWSCRVTFDV